MPATPRARAMNDLDDSREALLAANLALNLRVEILHAERDLVRPYMQITQTYQSWGMFAPNPTRANVFMKVFVTDRGGEVWDLYTDANSPRNKANPWVIYDRMGKITRRVTGEARRRFTARPSLATIVGNGETSSRRPSASSRRSSTATTEGRPDGSERPSKGSAQRVSPKAQPGSQK